MIKASIATLIFTIVILVSWWLLNQPSAVNCNPDVLKRIDQFTVTADQHAHGPDIGNDEWHSVVEFKLGLRGERTLPTRHTDEWCQFMNSKTQPSFDCGIKDLSTVERQICVSGELSLLDRKMNQLYQEKLNKLSDKESIKYFKAYQRGWIKGRNECWKANNLNLCIEQEYLQRFKQMDVIK